MSKNLRISLFGVIGAFAGFVLQGCFAPQPTPECSVTVTAAGLGLAPYFVKLDKVSGTGACANLKFMRMGMMRYRTQPSGGAFTLAVKPSVIVDPYLGYDFTADSDPSNDCVNEEDCQGADDPTMACINNVSDGGIELYDGTPVDSNGTVTEADGGTYDVDLANECMVVEEPLPRVDPTDPDGKKLNAIGQMPQFPTNGVCSVTNFEGGVQNFQEEVVTLPDGTDQTFPAATYKTEFTDFNVLNTTKVPGTAFTTNIKLTQGACVAEYKGTGFWPEIHCTADSDCDPNADLDAGRVFGSGINPEFKPKCDMDLEVCLPTVDVTTIK